MSNKIRYSTRNWHDVMEVWNLLDEFSRMTNLEYKVIIKQTIPWIGYFIHRGEFVFSKELTGLDYAVLGMLIENEVIQERTTWFYDKVKIE